MKTATAFITFIVDAHPAITLKHNSGFDDCAFGLYTTSIKKYSRLLVLFSSMRDEVTVKLNDTSISYEQLRMLEQLDMFFHNINNSCTMAMVAPTMGHLVKYMDADFPLVRSLVTT